MLNASHVTPKNKVSAIPPTIFGLPVVVNGDIKPVTVKFGEWMTGYEIMVRRDGDRFIVDPPEPEPKEDPIT